ncbi:MAG: dTDP-4-dehydrorhamnose reductase, partial [Pseudomonadota bacterium]|nr:dTDP-4-dehydrorhamnose reductase [Pseudomonadota bacterium]
MKIFVTGAAGMLASAMIPRLRAKGFDVAAADRNSSEGVYAVDVTDLDGVLDTITRNQPDWIFHLAAETDVDYCEQDPDHAFRVNTIGTENVALACRQAGARMLYISTSAVFPGDKPGPYTEFDEPKPANTYGMSKLKGEEAVRSLLNEYFIVRAGWMIGGWEIDKKFVFKIVQQIKEGNTELKAVSDKFGSPTFTADFAANAVDLFETGRYGLYHLTNRGTGSRYDIARKIVEFMGVQDQVSVTAIDSSEFPLPAPRADSEMLDNYHL